MTKSTNQKLIELKFQRDYKICLELNKTNDISLFVILYETCIKDLQEVEKIKKSTTSFAVIASLKSVFRTYEKELGDLQSSLKTRNMI